MLPAWLPQNRGDSEWEREESVELPWSFAFGPALAGEKRQYNRNPVFVEL